MFIFYRHPTQDDPRPNVPNKNMRVRVVDFKDPRAFSSPGAFLANRWNSSVSKPFLFPDMAIDASSWVRTRAGSGLLRGGRPHCGHSIHFTHDPHVARMVEMMLVMSFERAMQADHGPSGSPSRSLIEETTQKNMLLTVLQPRNIFGLQFAFLGHLLWHP